MIFQKETTGYEPAAVSKVYNYHTDKNGPDQTQNLDRATIAAPSEVLDLLKIRYIKKPNWISVYCPFHADGKEENASLSIHAQNGHYRCFTCGAKGGDVIAFYRAITGAKFLDTLKALGVKHV